MFYVNGQFLLLLEFLLSSYIAQFKRFSIWCWLHNNIYVLWFACVCATVNKKNYFMIQVEPKLFGVFMNVK